MTQRYTLVALLLLTTSLTAKKIAIENKTHFEQIEVTTDNSPSNWKTIGKGTTTLEVPDFIVLFFKVNDHGKNITLRSETVGTLYTLQEPGPCVTFDKCARDCRMNESRCNRCKEKYPQPISTRCEAFEIVVTP